MNNSVDKNKFQFSAPEERYMQRALQLAKYGAGHVSPNPMVGAVVVAPDGRIIGEGWHRRYGGPHAEVNAMASVSETDTPLLSQSTIYVTLEPCSHYGKTPPCSLLLINKGIGRVVVGSADPFPLVSGRGIKMLREAGIVVVENFMKKECDALNRRFLTAHTLGRPYIQLKWAQSADGYLAGKTVDGMPMPIALSTLHTSALMHSQRAMADAILVGTNTVLIDNPSLSTRLRPGKTPIPVIFDSPNLPADASLLNRQHILIDPKGGLEKEMKRLYKDFNITSLMVEGGAETLRGFINEGLFDEIRLEIASCRIRTGVKAPMLPEEITLENEIEVDGNLILTFHNSSIHFS